MSRFFLKVILSGSLLFGGIGYYFYKEAGFVAGVALTVVLAITDRFREYKIDIFLVFMSLCIAVNRCFILILKRPVMAVIGTLIRMPISIFIGNLLGEKVYISDIWFKNEYLPGFWLWG